MENKSCSNCHFLDKPLEDTPCKGCSDFDEPSGWQPMTNGDRVRHMTDEQLRDLWARTEFDVPICDCGDGCEYPNFVCKACPKAFYEWLQEVAKDE